MLIPTPTRLLVIDQDTLGENFIRQNLNPSGYEVIKVNSSSDGILTAQTWDPDVIIINIMQPSVNGWKLCRRLRQHCQVPILVLAAVSDPNSIALWLDAGADDYLTKPFSSDILVAHLQKLTRRYNLKQDTPSRTVA
jgi:DNA-binding response OmpR family regulator